MAEAGSLARELGRAYAAMVAHYQRQYGLTAADADAKARGVDEPSPEWDRTLALERPADEVSWYALQRLAEHDPDAAAFAWERIKGEALQELATGHRTAATLEWGGRPWDRARFLAVRTVFHTDWRPRGGIEEALVDLLAQSFNASLKWTERLTTLMETEGQQVDFRLQKDGYWQPPRIGVNEAIEQSAAMAERAHKTFLRTLRALQDMRRLPDVHVASAGQVNIGGQQVNVAAPADGGAKDAR